MLLIKNGYIMTMEETDYENGCIAIENGKIKAIGAVPPCPEDHFETVLDAQGKLVLPGFVDAHCHVGIFGEGLGAEGADGNEDSDPVTPQLRALDAVNPFDESFYCARQAGVTTVVTGPGSSNVFGGEFCALKTVGARVDDMVIKAPVAQKIALGENPKGVFGERDQMPVTRMATAALLRETLLKAKRYAQKLSDFHDDPDDCEEPEFDFKLESLLPVIRREIPLKAHAHRADDIFTAIRIAREFNIGITLEHCTEGHLIAEQLKEANIPIMLGPTLGNKSKPELKNLSFATYKTFYEMGIPFAIITDHPEIPVQYLPLCASLAVQNGVSERAALASITKTAAENTGISDRVGSLAPGKDADIIITDRDILSLSGRVHTVLIDGVIIKNDADSIISN